MPSNARNWLTGIISLAAVASLVYTLAVRWYAVEMAATDILPKAVTAVSKRVDGHDENLKAVTEVLDELKDAALVSKAKEKAAYKECLKFVNMGKVKLEDCKEPAE